MANYARGEFTITASSGTTINVTSPGFQPTWVMCYWNGRGASNGEGSSDVVTMGFGVSDGTNQFCTAVAELDAASTAQTSYRQNVAATIIGLDPANGAAEGIATTSMTASGFDVAIGANFNDTLEVGFICGDDTNAVAGDLRPSATGNTSVSGLGWAPGLVLGISTIRTSDTTNGGQGSAIGFGAYDGTNQWTCAIGMDDGATTMQQGRYAYGAEIGATFAANTSSLVQRVRAVSLDAGGFTVDMEASGAYNWMYLAIGGADGYEVGDSLTQTNTSNFSVTGMSIQPDVTLFMSCGGAEQALDTPDLATASILSVGAAASSTDRHCLAYSSQDGVATSEVYTARYNDRVYVHPDLADTQDGAMDFVSNDSGGFTVVMDDADPSQAFFGYVSFGNTAAASGTTLGGLVGSNSGLLG